MLRLKHCGWQGSMADVELMSMLDQLFQAITGTGTVLTIISVISFHHLFTIKSHDDQPTYCPGLCRKGSRKRQVQGERLGKNYSRRSWGSWCWEGRDIDFMICGLEITEASYTQWYVHIYVRYHSIGEIDIICQKRIIICSAQRPFKNSFGDTQLGCTDDRTILTDLLWRLSNKISKRFVNLFQLSFCNDAWIFGWCAGPCRLEEEKKAVCINLGGVWGVGCTDTFCCFDTP